MPDPSFDPPVGQEKNPPLRTTEEAVRDAVARERCRLADMLHRTASQSLTAAYYSALVLARKPPGAPGSAADLAALPDMIHTAIEELREITREIQGPDDTTLPA